MTCVMQAKFSMNIVDSGSIEGFVGFFDTEFKGSKESPAIFPVTLSTAPDPTGATHWGQQIFQVHPSISCSPGDKINCDFEMVRRKDNHRLLEIKMKYQMIHDSNESQEFTARYVIE